MSRRANNRSEVRKFLEDVSVWVDGCWHWIGDTNRDHAGYGCFYHKGNRILAHRYMWELMNNSTIPHGKVVRHSCDNPICVNPDHLVLGTQRENIEDMIKRDRAFHPKGMKSSISKVTLDLVKRAHLLRRHGKTIDEISEDLGLGRSTIGHILTQKSRYITWFEDVQ